MKEKTCTRCQETKPLTEFYRRKDRPNGTGYASECKECIKARMSKRYHDDPARMADLAACRAYGLTMDELTAMREKANGICPACGKSEKEQGHYGKLVIDHCHKTGKVRGLICNKCNTILGLCNDNIDILQGLTQFMNLQTA